MKKVSCIALIILFFTSPVSVFTQTGEIEITAQAILARVDSIMQYPQGEMRGRMKHISPDGKSYTIDFVGSIARTDYLFRFSNQSRGEELKVLYRLGGEDIWVYSNHSLKLFHKMGIDKYDSLLATNFTLLDFSNSDFQSNYNARITGQALIKGVECYKLDLVPVFQGSQYGLVTLYASKDKYHMAMDGTTAISDGTTVWVHLEDVNEVHISYAEDADDSMTPTALVERFDEAFRSKWIRKEDHNNREIHIIDLVPREPQVFFKYRVALDSGSLQIVYTEAHDRQGGVLRYDVVAFEANPSLDEGMFFFDPGQHPGIEVIDLR